MSVRDISCDYKSHNRRDAICMVSDPPPTRLFGLPDVAAAAGRSSSSSHNVRWMVGRTCGSQMDYIFADRSDPADPVH